jgi:hypothetical protein
VQGSGVTFIERARKGYEGAAARHGREIVATIDDLDNVQLLEE